ncbi:MAG: MBOAT family protein [Saprospiraceae bacterium]|nr:MBOAT family protein [Lewinella sp.]
MLFSSLIFLYVFLPLVLLLILISPRTWHNAILLFASLVFYAWGGVSYSLILIGSIGMNYYLGIAIGRATLPGTKGRWLGVGITLNLLLLGIFKYTHFLINNINSYLPPGQQLHLGKILLPLGISFYTFQAISYLMDVYHGRNTVQRNLPDLALYIALFPQLIAGPIVRYHDIAHQLKERRMQWALFSSGVERFILGLGKKVLLANNFAPLVDDIFAIAPENLDTLTAWTGLLFYSLQIYFDFSGYSDMAIGLGRMFGFRIPENFNFPYIARSIREFWRRWHISLSQWFRDYLYIPLGGNRKGVRRTYINLFIVFLLTGLWHGASWNFVVWGLIHGCFMVLERLGLERLLLRLGAGFGHLYTLTVIGLSWVFFRAPSLSHALDYVGALFGRPAATQSEFDLPRYLSPEVWIALAFGLLAATPLFRELHQRINQLVDDRNALLTGYDLLTSAGLLLIFLICSMYLASSAYNPFIYYRF